MAECEVCRKSPTVTALYRVNETGVDGRWRCIHHIKGDMTVDEVIRETIEESNANH